MMKHFFLPHYLDTKTIKYLTHVIRRIFVIRNCMCYNVVPK